MDMTLFKSETASKGGAEVGVVCMESRKSRHVKAAKSYEMYEICV